jgi:hypothetical protein
LSFFLGYADNILNIEAYKQKVVANKYILGAY